MPYGDEFSDYFKNKWSYINNQHKGNRSEQPFFIKEVQTKQSSLTFKVVENKTFFDDFLSIFDGNKKEKFIVFKYDLSKKTWSKPKNQTPNPSALDFLKNNFHDYIK